MRASPEASTHENAGLASTAPAKPARSSQSWRLRGLIAPSDSSTCIASFLHSTRQMKLLPVLLVALPFLTVPPTSPKGAETACVEIGGASVWGGVGWNHLVYLTGRCTETVVCTVSTNVDPAPQEVTVPLNVTVLVVTAVNSPAQAFVPNVSCDAR